MGRKITDTPKVDDTNIRFVRISIDEDAENSSIKYTYDVYEKIGLVANVSLLYDYTFSRNNISFSNHLSG